MKTLSQLIEEKKFDWVNSDIEKNFTATEVPKDTEYKLFHFDRRILSEDAVKEIEKEGWRPANISELLSWKDWKDEWVIALSSVARVGGYRGVPYLGGFDSRRDLNLYWFGDGWFSDYRFLAVRNSVSQTLELTLKSLESRIEKLEEVVKSHNL